MTSWGSDNRLHSTRQREESASDRLHELRESQLAEIEIDDIIEENLDGAFSRFEEPEDRYLDAAYEDRYYAPEPEFDYL